MKTRKIVIMSIMLAALCASSAFAALVKVDFQEAEPGTQVALGVRLSQNAVEFSAYSIPLKFDATQISVDSVSFLGSLATEDMIWTTSVDNDSGFVSMLVFPDIRPGNNTSINASFGLLATLHVTVKPGAEISVTEVDSVNYVNGSLWSAIQLSSPSGTEVYFPEFLPGGVFVNMPTGIEDDPGTLLPSSFVLEQNYPNPFNPTTTIEFALPMSGHVTLAVYNVLGQEIARPIDRVMSVGRHQIEFDASSYPSGIYFYRIEHASGVGTKKMTLIK
jgi:hypothetical protein